MTATQTRHPRRVAVNPAMSLSAFFLRRQRACTAAIPSVYVSRTRIMVTALGWRGYFARDHLSGVVEEVAVVRCAAGVPEDHADTGPASGAAAALGVVVGAGWDVAHDDGIEAAHVDTQFQGGGAGEDIGGRTPVCDIDACRGRVPRRGCLEVLLQVDAILPGDLGGVLAGRQGQ